MDIVERLTLEAAAADTMLACEHRQRYAFAAPLCAGKRVLDLCCGTGSGTAILAAQAAEVVGVDNDAATVELAAATIGSDLASVRFELADAVEFLTHDVVASFDVVVCFEGLEHLQDVDSALAALREHAGRGLQIVASIPNGKLFKEQNPYHVTEFGYDEAMRAFAGFPSMVMLPQFLAEGSLICPAGAEGTDVSVSLEDRDEPEYANHFIFCVNFDADAVGRSHHGRIQLNTSPLFNRWAEDLKRGAWALRRENTRLARARLGKAGSAAASALAGVTNREAQVADLRQRCEAAEARLRDLQLALAGVEARELPAGGQHVERAGAEQVDVVGEPRSDPGDLAQADAEADGDPNTWEHRRRRAADTLIPWIEQTVPLAGKTLLEYGCGNAAVSCAFAERAGRLIGVDIDPGWIELGNEEVRKRGLDNVELELHPLESIVEAVAARRGQVDVFLLYAVLEHLTVAERLQVLRLAREVVKPDGAIVVCETPNRLIYFDHHTAQMPFFHLLPDELAAEYYSRSARADFRAAIDQAAEGGHAATLEAIVRWGRGVSFHEFELVFGDRLDRHVLASNYDPLLFSERPVHPDEVILARYLERWRPDLAPVWSRYWLDVILSPTEISKRRPFLRPWSAETIASDRVGWTRWENMYLSGRESTLQIDLPHPTERLVVGSVTAHGRPLTLELSAVASEPPLSADASAPRGETRFTTFELAQPAQWITLRAGDECNIVFVGFDD